MSTILSNKARVLVKCGGFSTQLANHVGEKVDGDPLWGSRFDYTNPAAVIQTHLDFLEHGADIILTNTYQSSVEGYMKELNLSRDESLKLIAKSVELTKEAKTTFLQQSTTKGAVSNICIEPGLPLILASIGPYGAHLHDGSEYDGRYTEHVTKDQLQKWHRTRIETCLNVGGIDGLAVETIPCQLEAEALTELIIGNYGDVKFWISFQCKDGKHLAHGEDFAQAALSIWNIVKSNNAVDRLMAIGVNCTHPRFVASLFKSLNAAAAPDVIPLVVYSNRGEIYDEISGEWTGSDKCVPIETFVPEWIQLGARIIGGCCRVYPDDILNIRKCIDNIGNNN